MYGRGLFDLGFWDSDSDSSSSSSSSEEEEEVEEEEEDGVDEGTGSGVRITIRDGGAVLSRATTTTCSCATDTAATTTKTGAVVARTHASLAAARSGLRSARFVDVERSLRVLLRDRERVVAGDEAGMGRFVGAAVEDVLRAVRGCMRGFATRESRRRGLSRDDARSVIAIRKMLGVGDVAVMEGKTETAASTIEGLRPEIEAALEKWVMRTPTVLCLAGMDLSGGEGRDVVRRRVSMLGKAVPAIRCLDLSGCGLSANDEILGVLMVSSVTHLNVRGNAGMRWVLPWQILEMCALEMLDVDGGCGGESDAKEPGTNDGGEQPRRSVPTLFDAVVDGLARRFGRLFMHDPELREEIQISPCWTVVPRLDSARMCEGCRRYFTIAGPQAHVVVERFSVRFPTSLRFKAAAARAARTSSTRTATVILLDFERVFCSEWCVWRHCRRRSRSRRNGESDDDGRGIRCGCVSCHGTIPAGFSLHQSIE